MFWDICNYSKRILFVSRRKGEERKLETNFSEDNEYNGGVQIDPLRKEKQNR